MDSSNKKHNPSTRKVNSGELAFSVEIDYLVFQGHVRWDKLALGERWPTIGAGGPSLDSRSCPTLRMPLDGEVWGELTTDN